MLGMILLLALGPATAGAVNSPAASGYGTEPVCLAPPTVQEAREATSKLKPLGELPPGTAYHAVFRRVGKCVIPAVIGPARPAPNSSPSRDRAPIPKQR